MKNFTKLMIAVLTLVLVVACGDKRTPQVQYMPDMYVSVPYNANGADGANYQPVNKEPVAGTIARGKTAAYAYPNSMVGYDDAKVNLKSPLKVSEENLANGKKMYDIYCAVCHGKKGDGNGILSQRDKFNGIPRYDDAARAITEGSIYHVVMYGRNLMGSHASQLNHKERWQVVQYVEKLKNDLVK